MEVNLISDTVTRPTAEMLDYMMKAQVGDDVFKEDPTVIALETRVAKMFSKQAALFFPSGTMANQTAIKVHTQPGEQLIADKDAHVFNFEGGGVSFNSGVSCRLIDGENGTFTAPQVSNVINSPEFYHTPLTSLVCIENTANSAGGSCWDLNEIKKIRKVCDQNDLGMHLDGARIWNAMVARNESPNQYGELFDSISVCLSKGLGCPVGSLLIGDEAFISKALRVRKVLGGGMRQIGYLAAAGLYALDHHIDRLAEDHQRAKELAEVLHAKTFVRAIEPVETNIVIFYLDERVVVPEFLDVLGRHNIRIIHLGQGKLRMVTHLDYTARMHSETLEILKNLEL
ncbi:threonine aldolase family protein [Galbibacter sp.]|jgi:threonine aldolase|uniref:threonine aldolase family protein n=1 Tax=Galbibacter sp. TaxID=2918471 RepID=UPI003A8DE86F